MLSLLVLDVTLIDGRGISIRERSVALNPTFWILGEGASRDANAARTAWQKPCGR